MSDIDESARAALEQAIGYRFRDVEHLRTALTHRSYVAENEGAESYERLEFLGDAVLQLSVTYDLYEGLSNLSEGQMAKIRAAVVSEPALAVIARTWHLSELLILGRGEKLTGGREKDSILSDVVESILGAVYMESGFDRAYLIVRDHWADLVEERASAPGMRDYKTRLQESLAQRGKRPRYAVTESGPEHRKRFEAQVFVGDDLLGTGIGSSKKRAEQAAAQIASSADLDA
jgi:ribonuclease III